MSIDKTTRLESADFVNESPDNRISSIEQKFIDTYNISLNTLKKLKSFVTEKQSLNISNNTQDQLTYLKDFIQNSDIPEIEKSSLGNISENSFSEFAHEVFSQLESSKTELSQLDLYIHWEVNECIFSTSKSKYISDARFIRATNPTKPHHHIDGCIVGMTQSAIGISVVTWELILDTLKTPYHIYQIAKWEATTNAFKAI